LDILIVEEKSMQHTQQANDSGLGELIIEFRMISRTILDMQAQISGLHRDMSVLYNRENILNVHPPVAPVNSSGESSNEVATNIEGNNIKDIEGQGIEEFYVENENEIDLSFNNNEDLVNMSRLNAPNVSRRVQKDIGAMKQQKGRRNSVLGRLDQLIVKIYKNTPSFEYLKLSKCIIMQPYSRIEFLSPKYQFQKRLKWKDIFFLSLLTEVDFHAF